MTAEASALVRKIGIILANRAHLDSAVDEAFQFTLADKLQQDDELAVGERSAAAGCFGPSQTPSVDFETALVLLCGVLDRLQLPFERGTVQAWTAAACSTFALSRGEADIMTGSRLHFVTDWVLRCLADQLVRGTPHYYGRSFLVGFEHDTLLSEAGVHISGAVVHGIFGNVWLHAKAKLARLRGQGELGEAPQPPACLPGSLQLPRLSPGAERAQNVVCSVSKRLCRLPPELMSKRLRQVIEMERIPYVLPLVDAYEDREHIHLVYEGLSRNAVCLVDKVFDDMHHQDFCERTVQQIVWMLMSALKKAHGQGLTHGCLRMGCCYLNDHRSLESLRILEFGLFELFEVPEAVPPYAVLTRLELDRTEPVPPYRRDLQCVAEMAYLMLGGQPLCAFECSLEEQRLRFRRGAACFADRVYAKTSEDAKAFVLDMLRPAQFKKTTRIQPCQEAAFHMAHKWFRPQAEWTSTSAASLPERWLQAAQLLEGPARREAFWLEEDEAWHAGLVAQGLVVQTSGGLALSLGALAERALLCLPMKRFEALGRSFAVVSVDMGVDPTKMLENLIVVRVLRLGDIATFRQQWRSPAFMMLLSTWSGTSSSSSSSAGGLPAAPCCCIELFEERALATEMSWRAWAGVSRACLVKLCKDEHVALEAKEHIFDLVKKLVVHFIADASEETLVEILSNRAMERVADEEFWSNECLAASVDDADLEEIKKAENNMASNREFGSRLDDFIKTVVAKNASQAAKKRMKKTPGVHEAINTLQGFLELDVESMKSFLPPPKPWSWSLSKDLHNQRWLVSNKVLGRCSRSFGVWGEKLSAAMVLKFAWMRHEKMHDELCPHAWLANVDVEKGCL